MNKRKLKPKKCRACRQLFVPRNSMVVACTLKCAIEIHRRNDNKARKIALKTASDWNKEAQAAFNRYIRERDYNKPCISSGRYSVQKRGGTVDAGHYRSVGAASHLRFNVFNCHAQSVKDNRDLSGNVVDYRIRLIERIGLERVERLEQDNAFRKFRIDYLRRIKSIFSRRANLYKRLRERSE